MGNHWSFSQNMEWFHSSYQSSRAPHPTRGHSKGIPNPDPGKPVTLYAPNAIHSPRSFISTGSNYISAAVTISPMNDGMSISPPSIVFFANGSTQHLLVRRHPEDPPVCIPTNTSPNNTKSCSYHHPTSHRLSRTESSPLGPTTTLHPAPSGHGTGSCSLPTPDSSIPRGEREQQSRRVPSIPAHSRHRSPQLRCLLQLRP